MTSDPPPTSPGPVRQSADAPARRRPTTRHAAALVVFVLAGLLFSTSAVTAGGEDIRRAGRTDLADLVRDRERHVRELERDIGELRTELEASTDDAGSAELDRLQDAADALAPSAGLTEVVGPSLTITLDDSPDAPHDGLPPEGLTLDDFVVHQQDIEAVVNALWAGGAEAMMIMDQRVIGTSAVRCVGSVLSLHGRTYSPPYRITAVGDVSELAAAVESSPAVSIYREYARELGLGYEVTEQAETTLPPYEGPLTLRWVGFE